MCKTIVQICSMQENTGGGGSVMNNLQKSACGFVGYWPLVTHSRQISIVSPIQSPIKLWAHTLNQWESETLSWRRPKSWSLLRWVLTSFKSTPSSPLTSRVFVYPISWEITTRGCLISATKVLVLERETAIYNTNISTSGQFFHPFL